MKSYMPPGTAQRLGTAMGGASGEVRAKARTAARRWQCGRAQPSPNHLVATTALGVPAQARPMTSHRGAGYSSAPNKKFDPLSQVRGRSAAAGCSGGRWRQRMPRQQSQKRPSSRRGLLADRGQGVSTLIRC